MRTTDLAAIAILSLAGFAAGLFATSCRRPEPKFGELGIHSEVFRLQRKPGDPMLVTPPLWLELPMLREDFDLLADVELGEGAEVDLVLRRVEPRYLQGVSLPGHSRFAALRLSTTTGGDAWHTPTSALFGEVGGVRLGAGIPATIQLQARGRVLTASVAGKHLPPFTAEDDHGSLAVIARGGTAAINSMSVVPQSRGGQWSPWLLALASSLVLSALAILRRSGPTMALCSAAALTAAPLAFAMVAGSALLPLQQPELILEQIAALAGLPLALAILAGGRARRLCIVIGFLLTSGVLAIAGRGLQERVVPTQELDAVFGPMARETITETLAARIRGPRAIHTLERDVPRVFLLGGQLLWGRGGSPDQHIEPLLTGELRATNKGVPPPEVVSLPTVDGWSGQQLRMLDRFFRPFQPKVVVFGVPRDEAALDAVTGKPRSSPQQLREAIAALRRLCDELGSALVLVADDGLPADLLAEVLAARDGGLPFLEIEATDAAIGIARKLGAMVTPLLKN